MIGEDGKTCRVINVAKVSMTQIPGEGRLYYQYEVDKPVKSN
jgi:hypothetical protein